MYISVFKSILEILLIHGDQDHDARDLSLGNEIDRVRT